MVTEAHGVAMPNTNPNGDGQIGMKITVGGADVTLTKVTKDSSCTATYAYLNNAAGGNIASAAFSGNNATFNNVLSASTAYQIYADDPTPSNFTFCYGPTDDLPISGTYIDWTESSHWGTANAANIASVDVTVPPTGTNMQINIGDAWKDVSTIQINIGDTWKAVTKVQINIGDTWKTVFG